MAERDDRLVPPVVLQLFVTGQTPRSLRALANLRRICDARLPGRYELRVVDVLERPQMAEEARVLATPTLIRLQPAPPRRVIGDLSDERRVVDGLELDGASGASFSVS
ncbi:MAG: circadian clock KaiB family protein [Gemmatimonadaceae bacterium]|nr:circadian clock KaiB family protein [Gemmatimonadaceae bacterium]